jgi:hypothetical protein
VHTRTALAQYFAPQSSASHGLFERQLAMWCPYSWVSGYSTGMPCTASPGTYMRLSAIE